MLEQMHRSGSLFGPSWLHFGKGHQHATVDQEVEHARLSGRAKGRGACRRHRAVDLAIGLENAASRVAKRTGDALQISMRCHSSRALPENIDISFFQ